MVKVQKTAAVPVYNLILGVKSLANMGAILDFTETTITINQVKLLIRAKGYYNMKYIRAQFRDLLEPKSMHEAKNWALEILNAKYEKADLPAIIARNCEYLSTRQ